MKATRHGFLPQGWLAVAAFLAVLAVAFLGFGSVGCGQKGKEPPPGVKKRVGAPQQAPEAAAGKAAPETVPAPAETAPAPAEAESESKTEEAEPEHARLKRDPFKSFVEARGPVLTDKSSKVLTPLQRYKLEQLKVVGIVMGAETNKALLEDDVGKGYVVTVGDLVGDQEGKITAIEKDRLVIEESYRDVMGELKVRRIVKRLYAAEEGENP
jgi:Tfp pilus assembly protein PilP